MLRAACAFTLKKKEVHLSPGGVPPMKPIHGNPRKPPHLASVLLKCVERGRFGTGTPSRKNIAENLGKGSVVLGFVFFPVFFFRFCVVEFLICF